jgi:hypothetical protein
MYLEKGTCLAVKECSITPFYIGKATTLAEGASPRFKLVTLVQILYQWSDMGGVPNEECSKPPRSQ